MLVALLLMSWCGAARGEKPAALSELAVDQVALKGGPRLLGAVLGREADGAVAVAVGRTWLKTTHARFFEEALREETTETRAALSVLRERIAEWRKSRQDDKELQFFLGKEAERVESELKAIEAGQRDEDASFLVVDVAPAKIERIVQQPPQRRQVALAAWRANLADVETRSMASLVQELKKQKINLVDDPDLLLDFLPPRRQNDAEWAARRAIVEYQYRGPLEFQGTGDVVLRTGKEPGAADFAPLLNGLLKVTGNDPLSDLLDPPAGSVSRKLPAGAASEKWLAGAVKTAEAEERDGFRVTRVEQDLAIRRSTVETRFIARLADSSWKTVWQRSETADASKPRPDLEQQIEKDPQVRAALEVVKALGVQGDAQIKLAVRFGAATGEAQKEADSRFFEFRDRYLRRLDGPVLRVAPVTPVKAGKKQDSRPGPVRQ